MRGKSDPRRYGYDVAAETLAESEARDWYEVPPPAVSAPTPAGDAEGENDMSKDRNSLIAFAEKITEANPAVSWDRLLLDGIGVEQTARLTLKHRVIDVSAWSDGVVSITQYHRKTMSEESLDLTDDAWPLLDAVRAWQQSIQQGASADADA